MIDAVKFPTTSPKRKQGILHTSLALWVGVVFIVLAGSIPAQAAPDFEKSVGPLLIRRCLECHQGSEPAGKLDLTRREGLLKGGRDGPAVVPSQPDESLLIRKVRDGEMPPKKQGKPQPLPAAEVELLTAWVRDGAAWPEGRRLDPFEITTEARAGRDWWSLQPIRRPAVPNAQQGANPIDAFILAPLEKRGWSLAPEADRRTLLRRLSFDLLGLPPTFEEVEAFVCDPAPDAYEKRVEAMLASPHHGERWARHWLDVVRWAETCGYERDQVKPHAWKYRDWVIRAINDDKPYDRFVKEQIAGDELLDRTQDSVIATGFLRLGTWNDEPNDPQEYKYERLEDMVHAASTAFLGLTVKCARCHDHKFDPIRQTDYYRMASAFWAGFIEPGQRELLGGPDAKTLGLDVFGWTDRGREPPPLQLLKKGDPNKPGPIVEFGHLSCIPALDKAPAPPAPEAKTSHRRLQLAEWIVAPSNPLTARVWVNRVWQQHMGHGLVRSPDNLGFNGDKPTHPELLDWLASELIANGWSPRNIHRLIVTSRVYRQASIHPKQADYNGEDAGNRLWWRAERRRLDAESLRDSLLHVGGRLDLARVGGPSFSPTISAEALEGLSMKAAAWKPSPPEEQRRRAVYQFIKRGLLPPLMTVFDSPDTTLPCGKRDVSTVAPQALALLNNPFIHEQSEALAKRVVAEASGREAHIRRAWQLTLSRESRPTEFKATLEHLDNQARRFGGSNAEVRALTSLCHVLLNTNEFSHVD